MRGHAPLLRLRLAGKKPRIVFIHDFVAPEANDWDNPGQKHAEVWPADHCTVTVAGDDLSSLDLRFLVGLTVSIDSPSEVRARRLYDLACRAGAETVAACAFAFEGNFARSTWEKVYRREVAHA